MPKTMIKYCRTYNPDTALNMYIFFFHPYHLFKESRQAYPTWKEKKKLIKISFILHKLIYIADFSVSLVGTLHANLSYNFWISKDLSTKNFRGYFESAVINQPMKSRFIPFLPFEEILPIYIMQGRWIMIICHNSPNKHIHQFTKCRDHSLVYLAKFCQIDFSFLTFSQNSRVECKLAIFANM